MQRGRRPLETNRNALSLNRLCALSINLMAGARQPASSSGIKACGRSKHGASSILKLKVATDAFPGPSGESRSMIKAKFSLTETIGKCGLNMRASDGASRREEVIFIFSFVPRVDSHAANNRRADSKAKECRKPIIAASNPLFPDHAKTQSPSGTRSKFYCHKQTVWIFAIVSERRTSFEAVLLVKSVSGREV